MLSGKTRALLYRQLGEMARSGLPIERVFNIAATARRGTLAEALAEVARRLGGGCSLAEALALAARRHPGLFETWEIQFIAFGEQAGHLPEFLLQIADQAEETHALVVEIVGGFVYPLFLLYLTILVGPLATLILSGPAAYLARVAGPLVWVTLLLCLVGYALLQPLWRRLIFALIRPVPVFGKLLALAGLYRLLTGLALAYRGGLPLDRAWPLAAEASSDGVLVRIGQEIQAVVLAGCEVSPVLERHPEAFPVHVRTAYQTGEATGRLDAELLHVARILRRDIDLLRKTSAKLVNGVFYLVVAAFMIRNVLAMYRGPLETIQNIYRDLP